MARSPYKSNKRQKEIDRKKKKELKRQRKIDKKDDKTENEVIIKEGLNEETRSSFING
jgi:hypothetical protein